MQSTLSHLLYWRIASIGGPPPESCAILTNTMALSIDDLGYPPEWIYGPAGQPRCTAFVDCHDARTERCRETEDLFAPPTPSSTEVA